MTFTVGGVRSRAREVIVTEAADFNGADPQPETDLEYDLAHEWIAGPLHPRPARETPSVYVATQAADRDGDYGYDMAHDVPRR
jgi:hypothetical protein